MARLVKFISLFILLVLLVPLIWLSAPETVSAANNGIINGGFETGDFTGWNVSIAPGGAAQVVNVFNFTVPSPGNYVAKEGTYFALLTNGQQDVFTIVSQPFYCGTGSVISGWAFFKTVDYLPYTDEGMVEITLFKGDDVIATLFHESIPSVGSYGGTPWTYWSYALPVDAEYTIQAKVVNRLDSAIPSYLGLDGVSIRTVAPTPEKPRSSPPLSSGSTALLIVKNMNVTPQQAYIEQPISISANMANDGDQTGGYTASLKIDGKVEQTKIGTVDGHSAVPVVFTISRTQPGTYAFDIDGQKGTFTVLAAKTASGPPVSGGTIAIIIVSILVLGTIAVLALTFRRQA